ncbi:hypothetical protein BG006_002726, partial [Podila minutissima]
MTMERIISLLPSAAEIICLVGGQPEMVGRSHEVGPGSVKLNSQKSTTDDFPSTIHHLPILTEAKTKFTTAADVDRQVSEALSSGNSLYNLDVDQLRGLQPSVIVTQ